MSRKGVDFVYLVTVLLLWISSWSLIDLTIARFVPTYVHQMAVYGVMFIVALLLALLLAFRAGAGFLTDDVSGADEANRQRR